MAKPVSKTVSFFLYKYVKYWIFIKGNRPHDYVGAVFCTNVYSLRTRSRGRTGTAITGHRILSPACLPIPPFEQPLTFR